jgi:hypothetical protein
VWLEQGDVITANIIVGGGATVTPNEGRFTGEFFDDIIFPEWESDFATFERAHTLPYGKTALELILGVGHCFNWQFYADNFTNNVYIEPEPDFYDISNAVDWSDKLDLSRDYNLSIISTYNRTLKFSYLEDSNDAIVTNISMDSSVEFGAQQLTLSTRFGDGVSDIENPYFGPTTNIPAYNLLDYTPTPPTKPFPVETNFLPTLWTDDVSDDFIINGAEVSYENVPEMSTDFAPRLLYYEGFRSTNLNYGILFNNNLTAYNQYSKMFMIDFDGSTGVNLSFRKDDNQNDGLYDLYYKRTADLIEYGKLLKAYFKITYLDVNKLDPRNPIFISKDDIRGYWKVNKIDDWKPHKEASTKVELTRLSPVNTIS